MKLSELKPEDVKLMTAAHGDDASESEPLKLSGLAPDAVTIVQAERGKQVYEQPVGPEQAGAFDRFAERVQDPQRWNAIVAGKGPYAPKVVQGDTPLMLPGGAIPKLTKAAVSLAEGKGLGYALGRVGLSTGQGAAMSAADTKEGESWKDKLDRMKSGAKLSGGIQLAAESIPVVGKVAGYAARKLGSLVSGVDESLIQNYAKRTDEVNQLIKESGGDITAAADTVRNELSSGIQSAKSKLNAQISRTLESAAPKAAIEVQPIIDRLTAARAKLNPNFKSGAISEIDEIIASIRKEAKRGKVNVASLYQIKQFLNEASATAYNKGGQIFTRAGEAARAAKDAAGDVREMLKPVAGAISEADTQLSKLHSIERRLNKNLLTAGKPDAALIAAGSGANARNAANLRTLERISGVPITQRAKDLATAKVFANPSLAPTDFTGKAAARVLVAGGVGNAVAGPVGAAIGAGLASPMAVKVATNAVNIGKGVAKQLPNAPKFVRENPVASQAAIQLAAGQIRRENPEAVPLAEAPQLMGDPPKGEERWARAGLNKLGITDPSIAAQLLQDKKARRLLVEASDLEPGSRATKRILDQLQKGYKNDSITSTAPEVLRYERKPARRR